MYDYRTIITILRTGEKRKPFCKDILVCSILILYILRNSSSSSYQKQIIKERTEEKKKKGVVDNVSDMFDCSRGRSQFKRRKQMQVHLLNQSILFNYCVLALRSHAPYVIDTILSSLAQ